MTQAICVGFVGARFAAKFHWEGIRRVYGVPVEIVGVTSKTAEARDAFAREKGIRPFARRPHRMNASRFTRCSWGSTSLLRSHSPDITVRM